LEGKTLKKITPETLIQTIVEIRFVANVPTEAVFGMIYSELKESYPNVNDSDILQLPLQIRNSDPKLKFQAHHTIFNSEISIGIGPSVIIFNCITEYIGWTKYYDIISSELRRIFKLSIIQKIQRIGLRYMSFFEGQRKLFENVNMEVKLDKYLPEQTNIRTTLRLGDANQYRVTLQLNDKAIFEADGNSNEGGLVDIDVALENPFKANLDYLLKEINNVHSNEKQLFQDLLKEDFLKKYNPEYYV